MRTDRGLRLLQISPAFESAQIVATARTIYWLTHRTGTARSWVGAAGYTSQCRSRHLCSPPIRLSRLNARNSHIKRGSSEKHALHQGCFRARTSIFTAASFGQSARTRPTADCPRSSETIPPSSSSPGWPLSCQCCSSQAGRASTPCALATSPLSTGPATRLM